MTKLIDVTMLQGLIQAEIDWCDANKDIARDEDQHKDFTDGLKQALKILEQCKYVDIAGVVTNVLKLPTWVEYNSYNAQVDMRRRAAELIEKELTRA